MRRGQSTAPEARVAVQELAEVLLQPQLALVVFFCAGDYELDALAEALLKAFGEVPVIGCTSAGVFGPKGYLDRGLCGVSFGRERFDAVIAAMEGLGAFDDTRGFAEVQRMLHTLEQRAPHAAVDDTFGFLLVDGLSVREEPVARAVQHALGRRPLLGGSASDGLRFSRTLVYHQGRFLTDAAVLALVSTSLPFKLLSTQHFSPESRRVVVTAADARQRLVRELDGRPAAEVYAELVGVPVAALEPRSFAARPMAVLIGGHPYVRSISRATPDGGLVFFCAIEEGMVLRVAHPTDLVGGLERTLQTAHAELGELEVVLGGDCVLRRVEAQQGGLADRIEALLNAHRAVGFTSYGETFRGMHVNQTFTAVAVGADARGAGRDG